MEVTLPRTERTEPRRGSLRRGFALAVRGDSAARKIIDNPRAARKDRDTAEQREREAKREIQLLLNEGDSTEADFYVYRYLANEGFLPG